MGRYGAFGTLGPAPGFSWAEVEDGYGKLPSSRFMRTRIVLQARYLNGMRALIAERFDVPKSRVTILPTSWYRSYWYNRKIGGARFSQHVQARATDVVVLVKRKDGRVVRLSPSYVGKFAVRISAFNGGGIGVYGAGRGMFTHLDHRPNGPARW